MVRSSEGKVSSVGCRHVDALRACGLNGTSSYCGTTFPIQCFAPRRCSFRDPRISIACHRVYPCWARLLRCSLRPRALNLLVHVEVKENSSRSDCLAGHSF